MTRTLTFAHVRGLVCLLFVAASLLVPLEAAFACLMQADDGMQCPEGQCTDHCATQTDEDGGCMDVAYLHSPSLDGVSRTKADNLNLSNLDGPDLPAALPPREVLPDPPAAVTFISLAASAARLQDTDTYLLTQRLRL